MINDDVQDTEGEFGTQVELLAVDMFEDDDPHLEHLNAKSPTWSANYWRYLP